MKKSIFYYLFAVVCTVCLFTACSDDDDDDNNKALTVDDIVGTYTGTLDVMETSIPNTPISVAKVSDSKVAIELKDFTFDSIPVGDIAVECTVKANGDKLDINGADTVTIAALGNATLPVSVAGDSNGKKLDIDITITSIPLVGDLKVEYEGTK